MRTGLILLAAAPLVGGCATHRSLCENTLQTSATLTDLNSQQTLNNVALLVAHPAAMPSVAVITSGTVTDQKTANANATYAPTITFAQQFGSGLPILSLPVNPRPA
jgi:NADP-dependent 3-hydroxy acid dehydrogenase YdfG